MNSAQRDLYPLDEAPDETEAAAPSALQKQVPPRRAAHRSPPNLCPDTPPPIASAASSAPRTRRASQSLLGTRPPPRSPRVSAKGTLVHTAPPARRVPFPPFPGLPTASPAIVPPANPTRFPPQPHSLAQTPSPPRRRPPP